jgi:hypothetical protein
VPTSPLVRLVAHDAALPVEIAFIAGKENQGIIASGGLE